MPMKNKIIYLKFTSKLPSLLVWAWSVIKLVILKYLKNKIKNIRLVLLRYFIFTLLLPFINTYFDFTIIEFNGNDMCYYFFCAFSYYYFIKLYWLSYKRIKVHQHNQLQNETDSDAKRELLEVDHELNTSIILIITSMALAYIFGNKW